MELSDILRQIDSLKKEAEDLQPVKPEFERVFWEKFRLEFNYNSNHIEGNTLTYGQTKLLLLFDRTTGDNKGREIEEMKAHDVALKMITELSADPENKLTEKLIKEINELILVRPFYNDAITADGNPTKRLITPGQYKKQPNSVLLPDGNMFYYASPEETPAMMGDLLDWYNQNKDSVHPVQLASLMHYKFVRIHPFDDSNGRTTRLIMNYILLKNGYAPIVIESRKKDLYLAALNKADVGDVNSFVKYITEVSLKWQELFLKALKGENVEEPDDFEKEVELLKKNVNIGNKIKSKFSKQLVLNLFLENWFDLFKVCDEKLSKLNHFFFEKEIRFTVASQIWDAHDIYRVKELFLEAQEQITWGTTIRLEFKHKGFRAKNNTITNYTTDLEIYFIEYSYRITSGLNRKIVSEKLYDEKLSSSEIVEIANSLAKEELKFIKTEL